MLTRRSFLKLGAVTGVSLALPASWKLGGPAKRVAARRLGRRRPLTPDTLLDPLTIPKYVDPMVIPPEMPPSSTGAVRYYEIAVRQFQQQILPAAMGLPLTTVWSYGSINHPGTFNYPAFTIEAQYDHPVRVKWINGLVEDNGNSLPHLLSVDQTLHWANPPGGVTGRDSRGTDQQPYTGPVPIVTHVHGAHVADDSDGYAEAWFLPDANDIPADYATVGTWYDSFKTQAQARYGVTWDPGTAVFQYPNDQRATTLWYHDHSLGMTRLNVYAGPAGFYLIRGGPDDQVIGTLPGPAPAVGDPPGTAYHEIPIVIQDRSFNDDGSLFYPADRAYFEGLTPPQLQIPFIPDPACEGDSDISPIWNPEFFANSIVVNGKTWPYLDVEQRRYRFRLLNGCNSRFLILKLSNDQPFWQIGAEQGFLAAPVQLGQLLMAPAERADVIVDFTDVPVGTEIILQNIGPDEPFGGGIPGIDFPVADPATTGQIMQFRVVASSGPDPSTPPDQLVLPAITPLGPVVKTRQVSLNEMESMTVLASNQGGNIVLDCEAGVPFGPSMAMLGILRPDGTGLPLMWDDHITETPGVGSVEIWEIHNFTMDAHPIHIHLVGFEVVNREDKTTGIIRDPEPWESGFKDTVIAYPSEITRVKAKFDLPGLYVWHCHIVEHEDNEMMRPYRVVYRSHLPVVPKDS